MESSSQSAVAVRLEDYEKGFLAELARLGYASRSREAQRCLVRHLSRWLATRGLALSQLSEEVAGQYVVARREEQIVPAVRAGAPADAGLPARARDNTGGQGCDAGDCRGGTAGAVRRLPGRRAGPGCGDGLKLPVPGAAVRRGVRGCRPVVLAQRQAGRQLRRAQRRRAAPALGAGAGQRLACLARLHVARGADRVALAGAVGSFAAPAGTAPPRGLSSSQAGDLLAAVRASGPAGVRNEPMVALMLRLALRAGEVASLLLEDIDWRSGVLSVHGKGNRLDQVPLPVDVGAPLARYLRHGRPAGTAHRQVFLALDAPHGPLTAPAAASVAARALARAGITGPGAAHRLRHTAACGVLAAGGGFAEAGQLLRHTSPQATAVCAKSDIAALRSIARPWPEAAR